MSRPCTARTCACPTRVHGSAYHAPTGWRAVGANLELAGVLLLSPVLLGWHLLTWLWATEPVLLLRIGGHCLRGHPIRQQHDYTKILCACGRVWWLTR